MLKIFELSSQNQPNILDRDFMEDECQRATLIRLTLKAMVGVFGNEFTWRRLRGVIPDFFLKGWIRPIPSSRFLFYGGNVASIGASRGDAEMLRFYLAHGSNPLVTNRNNESVSDIARLSNHGHVINEVLMEHMTVLLSSGHRDVGKKLED